MSALLEPAFLRELDALRRRMEPRVRSGGAGERVARRRGSSTEFQEHRAYLPGDDLRRVDWLATARSGQPVLKQFFADEDVIVRLLVDGSASLAWGEPSKLDVARRAAAAIGYLALSASQRAQLIVGRDAPGEGARPLASIGSPRRGRTGLAGLLRELEGVAGAGVVDLARALQATIARSPRPGLLVVLSDFMDGGPVLDALAQARARGHEIALIQVLAAGEVNPTWEGDVLLTDAETGAEVEATLDAGALDAYAERLAGLFRELGAFARKNGAGYVRIVGDEPLDEPIRRFLRREID